MKDKTGIKEGSKLGFFTITQDKKTIYLSYKYGALLPYAPPSIQLQRKYKQFLN
jgi:hypothetical protein